MNISKNLANSPCFFTKRKFLQLSKEQQHKKCAEFLRLIYENFLRKETNDDLFDYYLQLQKWMGLSPPLSLDPKKIADQYHWHLEQTCSFLKEHNLLPSLRKKDKIPKEDFLPIAIYLDNIRSAYNVGSIIRTTEALRIGAIYCAKKTPFCDNEKVKKTSMGAYQHVSCYRTDDIHILPSPLIGFDTSDDAIPLDTFLFPPSFTIILGNEEYGISDTILKKLDYLVEIPLTGYKNSLNVACAFAIIAAEIKRQKNHDIKTLAHFS